MLTMRSRPPAVKPNSTAAAPASVASPRPRQGAGQAPSHLDRRKDLGQEMRHGEPRPPDHGPAGPVEQRLDPEAVALVARRHPLEEAGRLLLRHAGPERVPPERLLGVNDRELVEVAQARRGAGRGAASSASGCRAGPRRHGRSAEREPGRVGQRGVATRPGGRRRRAGRAGRTARHGRPPARRPPRPRPRPSHRW